MKNWPLSMCCLVIGLSVALWGQTNDAILSARVDELVRAQMREQKIPGVSLGVMRDGKIIKATGYGVANLELNVPVTPDSVFHTESVGKTFTAVGVLILMEEGKIRLDDKVTKYFPESPAAWRDVSVRQLLTHTSGIPDYVGEFGGKSFVDLQKNYTEDEVVRIIAEQPLDFPPGEKRAYSNSGYVILGALIRRVTGKNWADFLQERIFGPLGMTSTRVISEADIIPNRTSGYHLVNGQWKNTDWVAPSLNTLADGTLYTNVIDMAKWDEALSTEKILKRTTIDQMWVPIKLNNGTTFPQGLCFRIDDIHGHRLAWKDGEFQGYTTIMSRYLDDHLTVVVLTNLGEDATIPLHIAERVAGIYIPELGGSSIKTAVSSANSSPAAGANLTQDKPKARVEIPTIAPRPEDVSSPEAIVNADYESISGGVGVARQWARDLTLYDPNARYISVYREPKAGQLTPWTPTQQEYVDEADEHLVRVGFTERELAHKTYRFGNIATVLSSFEGKEQSTGKVLYRGVNIYQLYFDGRRWWISSSACDGEHNINPIPPDLLPKKK